MGTANLSHIRCVVFDVGETLVDETRMWGARAHQVGLTPFTLCGLIGALIAEGRDHNEVWDMIGVGKPAAVVTPNHEDLYPDALDAVAAVRDLGIAVGVAGNQPAAVESALTAAGLHPDFVASSERWGVAKPDPDFFLRIVTQAGVAAGEILYVGDRIDNDVLPARSIGMRTAFVRRGPWGYFHASTAAVHLADLRLNSLLELTAALRT